MAAIPRGYRRQPPRPIFNPLYAFAAIVVLLAVIIAGDKIYRWRHNRAPFGPDAISAHIAGLQVLMPSNRNGANVSAALRALGDPPGAATIEIPTAHHLHSPYVVGRLDIAARPAPAGSKYWLVVIDERTHQLISLTGSPAAGDAAPGSGSAWDGSVSNFALSYPWLAPLQEVQTADGYQDPGQTVSLPAGPSAALQFSGVDRADTTTPLTTSVLTVALLFDGPDGQTWWAKRLN